jgi:hypothetical protein
MSTSSTPLTRTARPEWQLIVACSRLRLDPLQLDRIKNLLEGPLDWTDVVETATRHRVESILYRNLASQFAPSVPATVMQSLDETSRNWGQRALFLTGQMIQLLDGFEKEGLSVIPYKGPTLAALAYGNFALRHSEDLDFVLPQKDVASALRFLVAADFSATLDPASAQDARILSEGEIGQYCFFSEKSATLVELHSEKTLRYFPVQLRWEQLNSGLIPVEIGGRQVRTFSIENNLLLLSVHGAKHFWDRLIWLCDIAAIVQEPHRVDWELAEEMARRMGCRRMWLLALALANRILDAPLPAQVLEKVSGDARVTVLARNVESHLACREQVEPEGLQRLSFRLRSQDTWSKGVSQSFRMATRPTEEDHRAYRLRSWAKPLFVFLRPWRLLQEYGVGLWRKRPSRQ